MHYFPENQVYNVIRHFSLSKLLLPVIFLLFFSGCNNDSSEKTNISIWMDNNDREMEFSKKIAKIYEEKDPSVRINLKFIDFKDLKPKFIGQSKSEDGPDIVFIVNDWLGELVEKKLLQEIPGNYPEFMLRTLESVKYKNKLYALPRNFEVVTLIYNKALVPVPPVSLKKMIEIGLQLKKKGIYGLMYDITDFYYHAAWFYGDGSRVFSPDGELEIEGLKRVESFQLVSDLKKKYKIIPEKVNQSAMINMFNSGHVGMIFAGPWSLDEIEKNNINYGLSLLPVLNNGNRLKPFVGVKGFSITTKSHYPEKARKIIEFFTSNEVQKMAIKELGVLPCIDSIYQTEKLSEKIQGFYEQANFGTSMPTYPEMKYIWQEYSWALNQIFYTDRKIEDILNEAANVVQKQVKTEKKL